MYKQIKINNDWSVAFETFRKTLKEISPVYKTGIRNWDSDLCYTYSLVIHRFRVMFYKNNHRMTSQGLIGAKNITFGKINN